MIDVHCHLEYMKNPIGVIEEARQKMLALITSVADIKDAKKILELQKRYPNFVFVSLGLHPENIFNYNQKEIDDYIEFIKNEKNNIVAIGEVGIDYNCIKDENKQEIMKNIFMQFIDLSKELDLPLVIHVRSSNDKNAFDDTLKILVNMDAKSVALHCFSGNKSSLKYAFENNYFVSFATIICRSEKHKRLVELTPIEKMLLETDSPWLDPEINQKTTSPFELTNRPWKIVESAKIISKIKNLPLEKILEQTTENAKRFFRLDL
ncbi:MAG: TatD family hydrolase [Candidatus Aenigmatarchaeota archaeon]